MVYREAAVGDPGATARGGLPQRALTLLALANLAGCASPTKPPLDRGALTGDTAAVPDSGSGASNPTPTEDTAADSGLPTPTARSLSATCDPDPDHPLRLICSALVDPPQTVTWAWERADGTGERWSTQWEVGPDAVTGLLTHFNPDSAYRWSAEAGGLRAEGEATTGPLPATWALSVATSGPLAAPAYAFPYQCEAAGVFVVDRVGRPLAYHLIEEGSVYLDNANRLGDGSFIVLYQQGSSSRLRHFRLDGAAWDVPLEALPGPAHHDAWYDQGLYFVLYRDLRFSELGQLGLDGLAVLDQDGGLLATWELGDLYLPTSLEPPYFGDVSHANSVWSPPGSGDVLLSFRHLDLVLRLRADPGASDFGQILWQIGGSDRAPRLGPELVASGPAGSDPGFSAQHHAWLDHTGRLVLFDNGTFGERSRMATWLLDPGSGRATLDAWWELDLNCAFQGAAWFSPGGVPLATCGPISAAFEFGPASESRLQGSLEISCEESQQPFTSRIQPYAEP